MDQKRIEYIDALRGFAILFVVFMRVPQYGFHQEVGGMYMLMAKMLAVPLLIVLMVIVVIMVATYVLIL